MDKIGSLLSKHHRQDKKKVEELRSKLEGIDKSLIYNPNCVLYVLHLTSCLSHAEGVCTAKGSVDREDPGHQ